MRIAASPIAAALSALPLSAGAQGTTHFRDALGNAAHPGSPANSVSAGTENASNGLQSRPV